MDSRYSFMKSKLHTGSFHVALIGAVLCLWLSAALAQDSTAITATRITQPPVIDGSLADPVWNTGVPVSQFVQKNPVDNAAPSQRSSVVVLYDDDALYIGARLYDTAPDSIIGRLVRRDEGTESDAFAVYLDSYHDHRTAYHFGLNPAGTRYDAYYYNDTWSDDSWEAVWQGEARKDSLGWTAEFRIPFSQLRFHREDVQTWGVQFARIIGRCAEDDYTTSIPKNESLFVSRFGHLSGIGKIPSPHYVELLPYVRGKSRYLEPAAGDPFNKRAEYTPAVGGDAKIGLGPDLILNATVNPDFGQVEVDPAVVNLSDVETYFDERRPFFLEGSKTFSFGEGGASDFWNFNWQSPQQFYSRRIGRAVQKVLPGYDFAKLPDGARILGAAKLTGSVGDNWTIGSLHAGTMREYGDLQVNGIRSHPEVEPASYYMVSRALKEAGDGMRAMGGIATITHRFFHDPAIKNDLNGDAFTGGLDGWTFLDRNKEYVLGGWAGASRVTGSKKRILALQQSSTHYFQRPDAPQVQVDSSATELSGYAARFYLNRQKAGMILNSAVGVISPGYDINDLGYLYRADLINAHIGSGYKWANTTWWTRYAHTQMAVYGVLDYGKQLTGAGFWSGTYFQFLNNSTLNINAGANPQTYNHSRTRGGPLTVNTPGWQLDADATTDARKSWVFGFGSAGYWTARDDMSRNIYVSAQWKPTGNLSLTFKPQFSWNNDPIAWVGAFPDPTATATYGSRYVFANLRQTEISSSLRMDWTFTPKISLQLYAQPLGSEGDYRHYKELSRPRSNEYHTYSSSEVSTDHGYVIDPDGPGPAQPFRFNDPQFFIRTMRGNMVFRWEYSAGSTLFLVWTHDRFNYEQRSDGRISYLVDNLLGDNATNIFMLKATYWLSW
jgi:hypothetical protein